LDVATGGKGGIGPFVGVCITSACFGIADAHVQGGMVGDLSFMCPEFIQVHFFVDTLINGFLSISILLNH
jgi:solute carrier family 29 (equilibrative nucleoside transporter), member 1/2/3